MMVPIFRHTLSRLRGSILGWGIGLGLYGAWLLSMYGSLADQRAVMEDMIKNFPKELWAFFGNMSSVFEPAGFLTTYFFSMMPIIAGIFAVLQGSGLLAGDEERGTLDLELAHPVSRTTLYLGRWSAFAAALILILAIAWAGFAVMIPGSGMEISLGALVLPFLSLFAVLMFGGGLALLMSLLVPSRSLAATLAGLVLVASYFLSAMVNLDPGLEAVSRFSPLTYYQGGKAVDGMEWGWFVGLLGCALLFGIFAWWRFQRRDIRIAGEGSWHLIGSRRSTRQDAKIMFSVFIIILALLVLSGCSINTGGLTPNEAVLKTMSSEPGDDYQVAGVRKIDEGAIVLYHDLTPDFIPGDNHPGFNLGYAFTDQRDARWWVRGGMSGSFTPEENAATLFFVTQLKTGSKQELAGDWLVFGKILNGSGGTAKIVQADGNISEDTLTNSMFAVLVPEGGLPCQLQLLSEDGESTVVYDLVGLPEWQLPADLAEQINSTCPVHSQ